MTTAASASSAAAPHSGADPAAVLAPEIEALPHHQAVAAARDHARIHADRRGYLLHRGQQSVYALEVPGFATRSRRPPGPARRTRPSDPARRGHRAIVRGSPAASSADNSCQGSEVMPVHRVPTRSDALPVRWPRALAPARGATVPSAPLRREPGARRTHSFDHHHRGGCRS